MHDIEKLDTVILDLETSSADMLNIRATYHELLEMGKPLDSMASRTHHVSAMNNPNSATPLSARSPASSCWIQDIRKEQGALAGPVPLPNPIGRPVPAHPRQADPGGREYQNGRSSHDSPLCRPYGSGAGAVPPWACAPPTITIEGCYPARPCPWCNIPVVPAAPRASRSHSGAGAIGIGCRQGG